MNSSAPEPPKLAIAIADLAVNESKLEVASLLTAIIQEAHYAIERLGIDPKETVFANPASSAVAGEVIRQALGDDPVNIESAVTDAAIAMGVSTKGRAGTLCIALRTARDRFAAILHKCLRPAARAAPEPAPRDWLVVSHDARGETSVRAILSGKGDREGFEFALAIAARLNRTESGRGGTAFVMDKESYTSNGVDNASSNATHQRGNCYRCGDSPRNSNSDCERQGR